MGETPSCDPLTANLLQTAKIDFAKGILCYNRIKLSTFWEKNRGMRQKLSSALLTIWLFVLHEIISLNSEKFNLKGPANTRFHDMREKSLLIGLYETNNNYAVNRQRTHVKPIRPFGDTYKFRLQVHDPALF